MRTRSKALLLLMCVVALVVCSIIGTIAYLTDTDAVTNTFSIGQVHLSLDEAKVDKMGKPDGNERWQPTKEDLAQEYHLLPGHSYTKDPTATVKGGSEDAYVRLMATITYKAEADAVFASYKKGDLFEPWLNIDGENWKFHGEPKTVKGDGKISRTYEFRYKQIVTKSEDDTVLPALFNTVRVPDGVTNDEIALLDGMSIVVEAHAIQASGFGTADKAWTAFEGQK